MPADNLILWWNKSSSMDRETGLSAFTDYHRDIANVARRHNVKVPTACAVFALCSPNNDYAGNLRSMAAVVVGHRQGVAVDDLVGLTTYRACVRRAYRALDDEDLCPRKGGVFSLAANKTWNFYNNILDPTDRTGLKYVTIDGHMYNLWKGQRATLKSVAAKFKPSAYEAIAADFRAVAQAVGVLPCQLQATLWTAYKRQNRIRFDPQIDLAFENADDWDGLDGLELSA